MNREIQLIINSKDREDFSLTSSTNFIVKLQNPINYDILAYSLESCCIPKTNYNVNSGFVITDSVGNKPVVVPFGNYSVNSFVTELQSTLNALGVDTYTVTFNSNTYKMTIVSSFSGFVINPSANSYPLLTMMGFDNETVYTSVLGSLTSIKSVDFSGIKNVYIKISELSEYLRDTRNLSSNFKVNYGCPYGSVVYFNNENAYKQYYPTAQNHIRRTDKFSVRLVDEFGEDLDLNGSDWSLVLKFLVKDLY